MFTAPHRASKQAGACGLASEVDRVPAVLQVRADRTRGENVNSATILVVDDEQAFLDSVARMLRIEGFENFLTVVDSSTVPALLLLHHEIPDEITVTTDFGDVPQLVCNPRQLNQVFYNLLLNAREAITGAGEISVSTGAADGEAYSSARARDRPADPAPQTQGLQRQVMTGAGRAGSPTVHFDLSQNGTAPKTVWRSGGLASPCTIMR